MNVSSKFLRILLVPGEYYRTEGWVTETLLANVRFRGALWEPAAGDGAMVEILEAAGYRVIASDIEGAVRGCQGAETLDFLTAEALPEGVLSVVTNPPFARSYSGQFRTR